MDIAVILKQVPDTEANIKINASNPVKINEDDVKFVLNPYDEFAVEEALQIVGRTGGEVIGVCIGSEQSESAIYSALAMGVEKAVLITDPAAIEADIVTQSQILARAIKDLNVKLVLCGREVIDTNEDATAAAVAEFMDVPHVLNASKVNLDGDKAAVLREIEGGSLEVTVSLPAVISCQKGLNDPRYPTLIAIKKAKKKEIKKISLADLNFQAEKPKSHILKLQLPPARSAGVKVQGDPPTVVSKCINWLSEEVKLI